MKRIKGCIIFLCCFVLILTVSVQPTEAKKFDKVAAKKKITVSYKKAPNGVLVIYKNKNKFPVKLTSTFCFLDSDKKNLSKEKQTNYCLGAGSTGTLFFVTPMDESGNPLIYNSYKCSFSVNKSDYKSYSKKISVSSDLQTIGGNFAAINLSNKNLNTIHVTIVFYDSTNKVVLCKSKYLNCFEKNSVDQFTINYTEQINLPQKAKVYIDWAY